MEPSTQTSNAGSSLRNSEPGPTRARIRSVLACNPCRSKKIKCDGNLPCRRCTAANREQDCMYNPHSRARALDKYRVSTTPAARSIAPKEVSNPGGSSVVGGDRPTPPPQTYLDNPVSNKKQQELRSGIAAFNSDTQSYQFYGPSSHFSFIQRIYQRIRRQSNQPLMLEAELRVPEGLSTWGVEKQMFTHKDDDVQKRHGHFDGSMLPKELGDAFIAGYFEIMHPQSPILVRIEIEKTWRALWSAPERAPLGTRSKERSVLYMVLAIGARLVDHDNEGQASDRWAEHFFERAGSLTDVFEETSLVGTHVLLLRAIYAMQIGRVNSVYLYLGHAARCATALGIHRSQVVGGRSDFINRLRLTFWTIYYMERMTAMFAGRPTCLAEDHIDAPLPLDTPSGSPHNQYPYIRAMVVLARSSDTVMTGSYSSKIAKKVSELAEVNRINNECSAVLQQLQDTLPVYLQFSDKHCAVGEDWQEVQRTCLGLSYHLTLILMYRPALVYVTFFDSLALAQASIGNTINIKRNMDLAVFSAKSLINLAHDTFFRRCPAMKRDGNTTFFIISACLTLLFEVLDSETTPAHATEVFHIVDKGLQCLDRITHIGSTTGRNISLDVMKIAKDALFSTEAEKRLESNLVEDFAWLNDFGNLTKEGTGSWLYNALAVPDPVCSFRGI